MFHVPQGQTLILLANVPALGIWFKQVTSVRLVLWGSRKETHFAFNVAKGRGSKEMHVPTVVSAA